MSYLQLTTSDSSIHQKECELELHARNDTSRKDAHRTEQKSIQDSLYISSLEELKINYIIIST